MVSVASLSRRQAGEGAVCEQNLGFAHRSIAKRCACIQHDREQPTCVMVAFPSGQRRAVGTERPNTGAFHMSTRGRKT